VDFGDILDRWERSQGIDRGSGRKKGEKKKIPGAAPGTAKAGAAFRGKGTGKNPESSDKDVSRLLSRWLETHGVYDKDAEDPPPNSRGAAERKRLHARRPDAVIDLHGLTRDQAWTALEDFFERGRRQGFTKLALIHGKGNHSQGEAVLKRTVREFIEHCPFAGESGQGSPGGAGVTWVLLK
jgi:DNA-nicking Smr family endonuclease